MTMKKKQALNTKWNDGIWRFMCLNTSRILKAVHRKQSSIKCIPIGHHAQQCLIVCATNNWRCGALKAIPSLWDDYQFEKFCVDIKRRALVGLQYRISMENLLSIYVHTGHKTLAILRFVWDTFLLILFRISVILGCKYSRHTKVTYSAYVHSQLQKCVSWRRISEIQQAHNRNRDI